MDPSYPGERATTISWFWADANSLARLAQAEPETCAFDRSMFYIDPGMACLALQSSLGQSRIPQPWDLDSLNRLAEQQLRARYSTPFIDWRHPAVRPVYQNGLLTAHYAYQFAMRSKATDAINAWAVGWLAYAGWLSLAVTNADASAACLASPYFANDPRGIQLRLWGMSQSDITCRLIDAWEIPPWAKITLMRLDRTPHEVERAGGNAALHGIVQLAIAQAEEEAHRLELSKEFDVFSAMEDLGWSTAQLEELILGSNRPGLIDEAWAREWSDPRTSTDLEQALARSLEEPAIIALGAPSGREADLHEAKLRSLAEFAAGAGHETNNPLAVISAHSQYLLKHEPDLRRRESLHAIVRQTDRIHQVLRELMLFARPGKPQAQICQLDEIIEEALLATSALADEREVRLESQLPDDLMVAVDREQIRHALSAMIRNGIEAAQAQGWVRVQVEFSQGDLVIAVEDSGTGIDPRAAEHLFDPFYSGRQAGRGRGLGLSSAWRLVQQHDGNVQYVPLPKGPTRFILTLPQRVIVSTNVRKLA